MHMFFLEKKKALTRKNNPATFELCFYQDHTSKVAVLLRQRSRLSKLSERNPLQLEIKS